VIVKKIYIPYLSRPWKLVTPLTLFLNNQNSSLLKLSASNSFNYKPGSNSTWKAFGALRQHTAVGNTIGKALRGLWNPGPNASTIGFAGAALARINAGVPHLSWPCFKLTTDSLNRTNSLTLINWAYQPIPSASIHVGSKGSTTPLVTKPPGLGLMALGAAGIAMLHRRRRQEKSMDQAHCWI
jgi:hypothetical protein